MNTRCTSYLLRPSSSNGLSSPSSSEPPFFGSRPFLLLPHQERGILPPFLCHEWRFRRRKTLIDQGFSSVYSFPSHAWLLFRRRLWLTRLSPTPRETHIGFPAKKNRKNAGKKQNRTPYIYSSKQLYWYSTLMPFQSIPKHLGLFLPPTIFNTNLNGSYVNILRVSALFSYHT